MKFKTLCDGEKWISKKLNNGEFDYWLVIELIDMDEACGSDNRGKPKYAVTLNVVSPTEAQDKLADAFDSCGITSEMKQDSIVQVNALFDYGICVQTWSDASNNTKKLLRAVHHEAMILKFLFGFVMDKAVNRIGTTGWDALRGDVMAGPR